MSAPAAGLLAFAPAAARIRRRRRRLLRLEEELERNSRASVRALAELLRFKEPRRRLEPELVAAWAVGLARRLGYAGRGLREIELASLPRDVGKLVLPDSLLLRAGRLNALERRRMRMHPVYGSRILASLPGFERVSLYVLHHHERIDGRGYPAGLKGEQIPLGARILSVLDAFEAMVSARPYRPGLPWGEAHARLRREAGTRLDPRVVDTFVELAALPPEARPDRRPRLPA